MGDAVPLQIVPSREVSLGEAGGIRVRRTLPARRRSLIGAWCFLDHFGPEDVAAGGGMRVAPHPHTALQTVTWLFSGKVEHRDSLGTRMVVRPGQLNLMTAGRGINHSEYSTADTTVLHGVQLWTALPAADRFCAPRFDHYEPTPAEIGDHRLSVFLGELAGHASPVATASPLVGAEVVLGETALELELRPDWEYGVLVDAGSITVDGEPVGHAELAYLAPGRSRTTIAARERGERATRLVLIGGEPLGEQIVMWWNFIGRSHEEIAHARANWQAAIGQADGDGTNPRQFGPLTPLTDREPVIPSPPLPHVRLRARG